MFIGFLSLWLIGSWVGEEQRSQAGPQPVQTTLCPNQKMGPTAQTVSPGMGEFTTLPPLVGSVTKGPGEHWAGQELPLASCVQDVSTVEMRIQTLGRKSGRHSLPDGACPRL